MLKNILKNTLENAPKNYLEMQNTTQDSIHG